MRNFPAPGRMLGLEMGCRCCRQCKPRCLWEVGSSTPLQAAWEGSSRRKNYSHRPPSPLCPAWACACISGHRNLPPCPGWGGLLPAPPFLLEESYPTAPSLLCLPFLALVGRGGEVPLLQQTPEDRAWQRNPPRNPIYLLLPPHTAFNQTPRGFNALPAVDFVLNGQTVSIVDVLWIHRVSAPAL